MITSSRHSPLRRRMLLSVMLLLALLVGFFPQAVPGVETPIASAHNLQTKMVYMFLDPDTQAMLDDRIAGNDPLYPGPPNPLLRVNDELGIIIKVVPRDGTTTGVGGHVDFYIPNGVQVIDAAYLLPGDSVADGITGYDKVPMKGQSPIALGAGPVGAKTTTQLIGLGPVGPNILGVTENPVVPTTGLHRGTIAGVYGDTGIFYSTHPDTAYGSWQRFSNPGNPAEADRCGVVGTFPLGGAKTITNNSGDVVVPCNKWDAGQLFAWGVKGTTCTLPGCTSTPIVDYGDGRGNAPWGFASGVAGPQSGYAWAFDWNEWRLSAQTPADMRAAMDNTPSTVGPWQRIKYPGSRIALDQPGSSSTVIGFASVDGSNVGFDLGGGPLPPTVSQTDNTSPKAIRWAVGQLTNLVPEYVWVKIRVNNTAAILNADGCPVFYGDTFGGDAGGNDNGKDHLWRYYEPSRVSWNGCVGVGKPTDLAAVKVGQVFQYKVEFYNLGATTLTNVVVNDTLPSGVAFISAVPAQNAGPNPLKWNIGTLTPGQKFSAVVTVKATGTGALTNSICVTSDQLPQQCTEEVIPSGNYPILKQTKSVSPLAVAPGGTVQYTIRIDNIGSGPTGAPVKIEEHLDTGFSYVGPLVNVTINGVNVTSTTTVNATDPQNPVFTLPSAAGGIQPGQSLLLTFNAAIAPSTSPGQYCNWYTSYTPTVPQPTGSLACVTVAGGRIGDTIWRDWDGDGLQDPGEEGIAGVTVKLYAADGVTLLATTTTDANGKYFFPGLVAGTYVVEVNNGSPLPGTVQTGDPDGTFDNRHTVTLATNQQYLTADFGYRPTGTAAIGDTVFEDVGNDGAFDPGDDTGIPGVTVYLYEDSNGDGVITPGVDALVATTTTNASGNYSFTGLAPGFNYLVYVSPTDPALTTYFGTDPYQASTPNPQPVPNLTGTYNNADVGFWRVEPSSIGDQVFVDNNGNGIFDAGDVPLASVTVELYKDGQLIATAVTGPDGKYLFENLGAGTYVVKVDPDTVPAGYGPTVPQHTVTLSAGETYLTADFPYVPLLSKTVNLSYATAGQTLVFSLTPRFLGDELLQNVRVIDPLPTGTTYVSGSANAGGTFGPYTPLPADPGSDPEGGPSGTVQLDTTITPSTNFALVNGAAFNVTLNVKQNSGSTVNNVSPTGFNVANGTATCTGPTPATANVPSGAVGANFVWSCVATSAGELVFLAEAANDTGTYEWPLASSASVLAAPTGGPNVVTWSLGSNTPGTPGETIDAGVPAGIYAFRGANTTTFQRYNLTAGAWVARAAAPNAIQKGGALTSDGVSRIWGLRGGTQQTFYSYDASTNAWTTRANTGVNVDEGGALVFLNVGGTDYVYALMGNGTAFRRYDVSANSWTAMAAVPAAVKKGGALATDGTYIYALRGGTTNAFYRYNPATNSWTTLANVPGNVGWGGALTRVGGNLYALQGDGKKGFYRYNIATNSWTTLAATPGNVADGGALTTDGVSIYAFQGKTTAFWRYDIPANRWTALAPFTAATGQGAALTYLPASGLQGRFTRMTATPTLVSVGGTVQVRFKVLSSSAVNNVTPSALTVTPTGGASASCTGPTPASQNAPANTEIEFVWTCSVTPGANPGSLTFSASASGGSGGSGYATAVFGSSSTTNPTNAVGAPDGNVAQIQAATGNFLTLDLGSVVPVGTVITLRLRYQLTGGSAVPVADVDGSVDGSTFSGLATISSLTTSLADYTYTVTQAGGIRYLRIRARAVAGNGNDQYVHVDSASFSGGSISFPTATSNSVLVSPVLTFQATVNTPPPTSGLIEDVGLLVKQGPEPNAFPSNTTQTATAGSIGDRVWNDADGDGVQDPGELGLAGVRVYLDTNNNGVWDPGEPNDITDFNGNYRIFGLPAGTYTVRTDPSTYPAGFIPTTPQGLSVTLATGQQYNDADFGLRPPASGSIGDTIWLDADADGIQDPGESGLPGIGVRLERFIGGNWYLVATTTTDANGQYLFDGLAAGQYRVIVDTNSTVTSPYDPLVTSTLGAAMKPTYDKDGIATPHVAQVTLATDSSAVSDVDFGYRWGGSIGDFVWYDNNFNGLQDETNCSGSPCGAPNGTLVLYYDTNGNGVADPGEPIIDVYETGSNGLYLFENLPPGNYVVVLSEQEIPSPNSGLVNTMVVTTDEAYPVSLGPNQNFTQADIGVAETARISGHVFHDVNHNGVLDGGDIVLPNVTVTLTGFDINGNPVSLTTTTGPSGEYLFLVPPGNYTISYDVNDPDIPLPIRSGNGMPTTPLTINLSVASGVAYPDNDFGRDHRGAVGDRVWNDADGDGVQDPGEPGIGGVTVQLYASDGVTLLATTVTDGNGNYLFPGLPDGTYVVKVVPATLPPGFIQTYDNLSPTNDHTGRGVVTGGSSDLTADFGYRNPTGFNVSGRVWHDLDGTGTQGPGEPGIPGVTVCLVNSLGVTVACTVTDGLGNYTFPGVPNGSYTIQVNPTTLPNSAYAPTFDPDGIGTPHVTAITVSGANVTNQNFGYQERLGSIRGTVCEGNGDGQCDDPGELPGLPGVPVFLTWAGPDNILGTPDDTVTVTTTDGNGDYVFTNLLPGLYQITKVNPPGYVSLADADGGNPTIIYTTLAVGQNQTDRDFEVERAPGAIGDRVWLDVDGDGVEDIGEPGLANVTVYLCTTSPCTSGNALLSAVTDANGNYLFTSVPPGTYFVGVDPTTLPAGLVASPGTFTNTTPITLASGENFLDADFGYVPATGNAVIGDFVWADMDADGIQDPGEIGLAGVTVRLKDLAGNTLATTTTGPDGTYLFTNVSPGSYRVEVVPPAGYTPTSGPESEGGNLSRVVTVLANDVVVTVDFGYDNPNLYTISDRVWYDTNQNGVLDPGEDGIGGVTVNLLDSSGNVIATVVTAPDGTFTFSGVPNGSYTIEIADNTGQLTGLQPTTSPALAGQLPVTVSGGNVSGVNFGYAGPGLIGDTIWSDHNGNGVQDLGEIGIAGVTVQLYLDANGNGSLDPTDPLVATTLTDAGGHYLFTDLPAATYFVVVVPPAGYTQTGDPDSPCPGVGCDHRTTVTLTLTSPSFLDADFGYRNTSLADVSGTVWNDINSNGVQDGTEPGIPGVTVCLLDDDGNVVACTVTDPNGNYIFYDVPPGDYSVVVTDDRDVLNGHTLTSGLDEIPITVGTGNVTDVDFGYVRNPATGAIGDRVWHDANRDGAQNGAEGGIPNVTVRLRAAAPVTIGGVTYLPGQLIATDVTDLDGYYLFSGLPAGSYYVEVDTATLPTGLAPTVGTTNPTATINLSEGQIYLDADFGYASQVGSAIGDRIWNDLNGDGIQDPGEPGIGGVTVVVVGPSCPLPGCVAITDPDGTWLVSGLTPGNYQVTVTPPPGFNPTPTNWPSASQTFIVQPGLDVLYADFGFTGGPSTAIGDRIWLDADGDGVQDVGEHGIPNVTVNLVNNAGVIVATTTTDANGNYLFTGVADGTYTVVVSDVNNVLAGLLQTFEADPTLNGQTTVVVLGGTVVSVGGTPCGSCELSVDFGYRPAGGVIGNQIWHDLDGDGFRDPGEPGFQGVTVELWLDVDGDGAITPGLDNLVRTEITDINGQYFFIGLPYGSYLVTVTDELGVLAGFQLTVGLPGVDDNSQVDPYAVILSASNPTDYTADFGYTAPGAGYSISGTVFNDLNNNGVDDGEPPLPGTTVFLYRELPDGTLVLIGTTVTDSNGDYVFPDLPPGNYVVATDALSTTANGYYQTTQTGPSNPVQPVTIVNANVVDQDFGYHRPAGVLDYGDLPDRPYSTLLASNGARHTIVGGAAHLGTTPPDAEPDGQPTAAADGDDISGVDDEDGVTFLTPLMPGTTANIRVVITDPDGTACLSAFIDFNGDGLLDPVTYTAIDSTPASGTVGDLALSSGPHVLTISVPATTVGTTPARFRVTDQCGQNGNSATGLALNGEVEDYVLAQLGDRMWIDVNGNGQQDPGEPPLAGGTVRLLDSSGNPVLDAAGNPITTVTNAGGNYSFPGLPPGTYIVEFVPPPGLAFTAPNVGPAATDSDADQVTGRTAPVTVVAGQVDLTVDAGVLEATGVAIGNLVFCDVNGNGIFDPGDTGQSGVTVRLYGLGPDATPYTADDVLVGTTVTNAGGFYLFLPVVPGQYYVAVVAATVPGTCGIKSSAGGGWNPDIGDHNLPQGDDGVPGPTPSTSGLVVTGVLTALPNAQTTPDTGDPIGYADASSYMTVDFGFTNDPNALGLSGLQAEPLSLVERLVSWLRALLGR